MSVNKNTSETAIGGFRDLQYCKVSNIDSFPSNSRTIKIFETDIVVSGDGWQDIEAIFGTIAPSAKKTKADAGIYYDSALQCQVHENNADVINELHNLREKVILRYVSNRGVTHVMGTKKMPLRQLFEQPEAPQVGDFAGEVITFSGFVLTPPLQICAETEE